MKEYVEIPFIEYVGTNPILIKSLRSIGGIPLNALQDITKTKEYRNASPAQIKLLDEVDLFWYRVIYWIAFYRLGNLDLRLKPLSVKEFKVLESFGYLYSKQLDLTIGYHTCKKWLPEGFANPMDWWTSQILEIKNSWYYSVFYPSKCTKTEAINKIKIIVKSMRNLSEPDFSNLPESSENLLKLSYDLAYKEKYNNDIKRFREVHKQFIKSYQEHIKSLSKYDRKNNHSFQTAYTEDNYIYVSNQKNWTKILI